MASNEEDIITFDKYYVENELINKKVKECKIKNATFSLLPNIIDYKQKEKYFVNIANNHEHYIGALNTKFQKELFGYILFYQGDEYLGQILKEKKNGFGIYIFKSDNKSQEIYIGHFSENIIEGEGIYINILEPLDKNLSKKLNKFNCRIGKFEKNQFIKGKIYTVDNDFEKLEYQDDEKELKQEEKEVINIEKRNNFYFYSKGVNKEKRLISGTVITIKDNGNVENKFYFNLNDNLQYVFNYLDDEKLEKKIIEEFNNTNFNKFHKSINDIFTKIIKIFNNIKNNSKYDDQFLINDNFKNYFSNEFNLLM